MDQDLELDRSLTIIFPKSTNFLSSVIPLTPRGMRLLNPSLWISNLPDLDTVFSRKNVDTSPVFLILLGLVLLIITGLGYGFYLWYLNTSSDQGQRRLLNILYGYLSLICMMGALCGFMVIVGDQTQAWNSIRVRVSLMSALTLTFLLISLATIMSHFKPSLYLEMSLKWKNGVAIPVFLVLVFVISNVPMLICVGSENASDCTMNKMRITITIPATLMSTICQLTVVVDDLWGWRNIISRMLRGVSNMCKPNAVTPENSQEPAKNQNTHQFPVDPYFKLKIFSYP